MSEAPISLTNDALGVEISLIGAELIALRDARGRDMLWSGDPAFWSGRAPLLFPMVGRAAGDRIRIDGVDYPLPQHGFARRSRFTLVEAEQSRALLRLEDDAETREKFPFHFRLDVEFALDGATLAIDARVENRDSRAMPCAFGFHPAFRWPLPGATGAHDLSFEQQESAPFYLLDDGLLAPEPHPCPIENRKLALTPDMFERGALVFQALNSREVSLQAPGAPKITVGFAGLPHFGLWSKPGAPFVCLEPWQGYAAPKDFDGEFSQRPGVVTLAPGAAKNFAMTIAISA